MTWLCPHCGYQNRVDPLNSRHDPLCLGCHETFETPERLLKIKTRNITELKEELKENNEAQIEIHSHIESPETDLAEERGKLNDLRKDYSTAHTDLKKWENTKIYGIDVDPVDKVAKARTDIKQKTLEIIGVRG
jgi:chromosome segregation ATPase